MKYPLEDLLRVRQFREDERAQELTRKRGEVEAAAQLVEKRKQELTAYTAWRINREKELYDEVMLREIEVKDLDALKLNIQILRENELAYGERVKEAEKALEAAQQALAAAQAAYMKAVRDKGKIEEHKGWWAQEEAKEAEANAEKELEDFRVRTPETDEANHE
jgi:hypothetical protein